jgi:hypothetical protein
MYCYRLQIKMGLKKLSVLLSRLVANTRDDGSSQRLDPVWGGARIHRSRLQTSGTPSGARYTVPWGHILRKHHHVVPLGPTSGRSDRPTLITAISTFSSRRTGDADILQTVPCHRMHITRLYLAITLQHQKGKQYGVRFLCRRQLQTDL